jgi:hypothetical protein
MARYAYEDPEVAAAAEAALANYNYENEVASGAHGSNEIAAEAGGAAVGAAVGDDYVGRRRRADDGEEDGYVGRRRRDDPEEKATAGADAAADDEPVVETAIELIAPIGDDEVEHVRKEVVREVMTKPEIDAQKPVVRSLFTRESRPGYHEQYEPHGGYYEPIVRSFAKSAAKHRNEVRTEVSAEALAKDPADRTDYDDFILGQDQKTQKETRDPRKSYYQVERRMLEDLQAGRMPADFRDVASLERATAYLIDDGLAYLGAPNTSSHRSPQLMDAVSVLREATLRVPGFNPMNAGVDKLYGTATTLTAALSTESYHWGANRAEHGSSTDWVAGMVAHCLKSAEDVYATVYLQGRQDLLVPAEPAAV